MGRTIDLNSLIRYDESVPRYGGKIKWEDNVGKIVNFEYDNIKSSFIINSYDKKNQLLNITFKIYNINTDKYTDGITKVKLDNNKKEIYAISKTLKYIKLCKKYGHTLSKVQRKYFGISQKLLNSGLTYLGYENFEDLLLKNNIKKKTNKTHNYFDVYLSHKEFFEKYDRFPVNSDYKNKLNNLVSKVCTVYILKENNMTYEDLFKKISHTNYNMEEYEYNKTITKFKEVCIKENKVISVKELQEKIGHDLRWIMERNKNIKSYKDFYIELGFKKESDLSKEEIIEKILNKQSKLNRPLMYDDFRNNDTFDDIGIHTINNIFGSLNMMKQELGLKINQEDMVSKSIKDFNLVISDIKHICNKVFEIDNRKTITGKDIDNFTQLNISQQTIRKYCNENGYTLRNIITDYGFELQNEGTGLTYSFDDGERVVSSLELCFSKKLREYGYTYNKDYKRDVRYNTFIKDYNDFMNCDYVIIINNKVKYIEIAGILNSEKEKFNYKNNLKINCNRKEKYRLKLMQKEKMLKDNNLDYFILFPSDFDDLDYLFENVLHINKI